MTANSNFNDKGWSANLTGSYGVNNVALGNVTGASQDVYGAMNRVGVFIMSGSVSSGFQYLPVPCSALGLSSWDNVARGFLVYPGFGFTAYIANNYGTPESRSRTYHNNTDKPVIFYAGGSGWSGTTSTPMYQINGSSYPPNPTSGQTSSIVVYYRGAIVNYDGVVGGNPTV